jgi:hypothetical protein
MPNFTVHANDSDGRSLHVHRTIHFGLLSVICALTLLPLGSLRAAELFIANASFEDPVLADDAYTTNVPISGWQFLGSFSGIRMGVWNPTTTDYLGGVPNGSNLFWCSENTAAVPQSLDPRGVSQILADNLMPNTTYVLTVQVGNPPAFHDPLRTDDGFPGYQVELLAGGVVVALDRNSLLPANGAFVTSTVVFTTGNTHPQQGLPLEIRLLNQRQQAAGSSGPEVHFDDVQLSSDPAVGPPSPAPVLNARPIADAGPDATYGSPSGRRVAFTLSGINSFDPDGTVTHYTWELNGVRLFGGESPVVAQVNNAGTYTYTLTVIDNEGSADADSVTVTIKKKPGKK